MRTISSEGVPFPVLGRPDLRPTRILPFGFYDHYSIRYLIMANELHEVDPGDLVESELINHIVRVIEDLKERVGAGIESPVTVPLFIGLDLGTASDQLERPNVFLQRAPVLDVAGQSIDPDLSEMRSRTVVSQLPSPGERVSSGTPVRLLVSAGTSGGDDGDTTPPPEISFPGDITVPLGTVLTIPGANFLPGTPEVTVDGVPATIERRTSVALDARVPETISLPGGAARLVPVSVTVRGVTVTDDDSVTLVPKPPGAQPTVTGLDVTRHSDENVPPEAGGPMAHTGTTIVALGENYVADASKVQVVFEHTEATEADVTAVRVNEDGDDEIDFVVPDLGVDERAERQTIPFRVHVEDAPPSDRFESLIVAEPLA